MHLKKLDSIRYSLQKVGLKACRIVIKEVRELLDEDNIGSDSSTIQKYSLE